jgi:hypothetical protein
VTQGTFGVAADLTQRCGQGEVGSNRFGRRKLRGICLSSWPQRVRGISLKGREGPIDLGKAPGRRAVPHGSQPKSSIGKQLQRLGTNWVPLSLGALIPPEQCRGSKTISDRTDVYSFGVMLYEMLAGRTPFVAEDPGEYIGQHIYKDPPPIGSVVPSLAPALQRLVESMLLKDPQARPSMAAVARVLKELGNFSSDVVSVRALVESHAETVPLLRALPQKLPRAPDESPAAWRAPTDPMAARRDVHADARPADPGLRDTALAPAAGSEPPDQAESTKVLGRESIPGPGSGVDISVAVTDPSAAAQPGWQTLNVVKGGLTESKTEAPLKSPADAAQRRRKPSLVRALRRTQLRTRRWIYQLFGIPLAVQPGSSSGSQELLRLARIRNRILGTGAVVILLLVTALLIRLLLPELFGSGGM